MSTSGKAFFIDLTKCDACRGCQVSCAQWHDLGAIKTKQVGTHQNPPELNYICYKTVHFKEKKYDGKLQWLFFPEQCRHCFDAPCQMQADSELEGAIYTDETTGAVIYTEKTKEVDYEGVRGACPYDVPRQDPTTKVLSKCDLCVDRIHNNMVPSCVKTCHSGAMNYGSYDEMRALAQKRLEEVQKESHPQAVLGDPDAVRIIYLFPYNPKDYFAYAVS